MFCDLKKKKEGKNDKNVCPFNRHFSRSQDVQEYI